MSASRNDNSPPVLTVAMIVCNAEELIGDTIDSVREIADEFVICDTGSSDETVTTARAAGAVVHEIEWDDDFAAARNACWEKTSGDWVLWLDAGETIDRLVARQIRRFVDRDARPHTAYLLFVQLASTTAQLSGEQIGQIRLVPRSAALTFCGRIRETLLPSITAAGLTVDALPCQIHRPPTDHDKRRKVQQAIRNLAIADRAATESGETADLLIARAAAYENLGRHDEAAECYRRAIELSERGSSQMLESYYGLLTTFDARPEEAESQISICLEALDVYPLDAQLLCGMGSYLLRQNRLDLAARSYEIAATHGQVDPATWHLGDIAEVAAACLSMTHQLLGHAEEARDVLERALEQRGESARLRRQLIDLLIKQGQREAVLEQMQRLPEETPHREALKSAIRGALLAVEQNWGAAEPYLKTAYSAGCRDPLCLKWLTITCLATHDCDAAEPILTNWMAIEPESREAEAYRRTLETLRNAGSAAPATGTERAVRIDAPASRRVGDALPAAIPMMPVSDPSTPVS